MTIAATQPEMGDVIAELLRRVSTLEQHNAEIKKALNESEKRQAASETASETKYAESEKRQTANEKETAVIDARLDALATKEDVAKLQTQIARLETQNERNSKNNIKWIVGTGIALAAVIFAAPMLSAG